MTDPKWDAKLVSLAGMTPKVEAVERGVCDKCGEAVPYDNDAVALDIAMGLGGVLLVVANARHLLPTDTCEGSPSRAQYLEGAPRDPRGYGYDESLEPVVRAAYDKIKEGSNG